MIDQKSRKELINEYKQLKPRMGVYAIKNLKNGKILVGSNVNADKIWNRLQLQLGAGSHPNATLQADWKELGEANFSYEILSELQQKDGEEVDYNRQLKELEDLFLEELQPYGERGYNKKR